jgi:RimJ/RimL family protein N-acetyltransferase
MKAEQTVHLIQCTKDILQTIMLGDEILASVLDITVPEGWSEFGESAFMYTLDQLQKEPGNGAWYSYLPVLMPARILIGSCGFKGAPDAHGTVELGYEVCYAYRNRGLATMICNSLITKAFTSGSVKAVIAHTLPEKNASVRVLEKNGFVFDGETSDPKDGLIWRWKKKKE